MADLFLERLKVQELQCHDAQERERTDARRHPDNERRNSQTAEQRGQDQADGREAHPWSRGPFDQSSRRDRIARCPQDACQILAEVEARDQFADRFLSRTYGC